MFVLDREEKNGKFSGNIANASIEKKNTLGFMDILSGYFDNHKCIYLVNESSCFAILLG